LNARSSALQVIAKRNADDERVFNLENYHRTYFYAQHYIFFFLTYPAKIALALLISFSSPYKQKIYK
jgi:hypothetical protein